MIPLVRPYVALVAVGNIFNCGFHVAKLRFIRGGILNLELRTTLVMSLKFGADGDYWY
jgi:hypothetical protein